MLTACLVDLPPAFSSFSFFSCFSYCFSSSFCFCWYIFLKVTGAEEDGHHWVPSPLQRGVIRTGGMGRASLSDSRKIQLITTSLHPSQASPWGSISPPPTSSPPHCNCPDSNGAAGHQDG